MIRLVFFKLFDNKHDIHDSVGIENEKELKEVCKYLSEYIIKENDRILVLTSPVKQVMGSIDIIKLALGYRAEVKQIKDFHHPDKPNEERLMIVDKIIKNQCFNGDVAIILSDPTIIDDFIEFFYRRKCALPIMDFVKLEPGEAIVFKLGRRMTVYTVKKFLNLN